MTEDEKRQVATFRFGVIGEIVTGNLDPGEQEKILEQKTCRKWQIPFSERSSIGKTTILDWVRRYRKSNGNIESLYPKDRCDRGKARAIDPETECNLIELRQVMPEVPVEKIIDEMHKRNLVAPATHLRLTTVYRLLNHHHLVHLQDKPQVDRRKFEAELPNDLWQADCMHGPHIEDGAKLKKTYLLAFIDDHSRLVPHGKYYWSERLDDFLDAFQSALLKRGLPRKLYLDNGAAFRSHQLQYICAALGISLVHSKPYTPQGRGKIERFFRSVRTGFLAGFTGKTVIQLNEAFDLWLNHTYHQKIHSGTGQSPFARFTANTACLRAAPENLKDFFRYRARRRVAKDRSVVLNGKLYEAPVCLIGNQVELLYHRDDFNQIEVLFQNRSYGILSPVDTHVNCRILRTRDREIEIKARDNPYQGGKLL